MFTFSVANGDLAIFTVTFEAKINHAFIEQYRLANNGTEISLTPTMEGSGLGPTPELVYDVLNHYAYIALGNKVLIVHLNTSNAPYLDTEVLEIDQTANQIKALIYQGDHYVMITYTTPQNRQFLRTFRKYQNKIWGRFGSDILVSTPVWYNLTLISNTLIYKAANSLSLDDTLWVAIAHRWYIYTQSIIDSSTLTFAAPEPCNNIQRLVYSEHKQRMLIQCKEATVFFDAQEKSFFEIWEGLVGTVYISHSGKYGAVVSRNEVTLLRLHNFQAVSMATDGVVDNVVFADAGSSIHYFCYVEQIPNQSYNVNCIHIELMFQQNITRNKYLTPLLDSSILSPVDSTTPRLYSHRNILTIQYSTCAEQCTPLVQVFDMQTLKNTHNITGVDPTFLTFKPRRVVPSSNTTKKSINETIEANSTELFTKPTALSTDSTTTSVLVPTTTLAPTESLQQCSIELEHARTEYQQLLWVTVTLSCVFSILLLISLGILTTVLWSLFKARTAKLEGSAISQSDYKHKEPADQDTEHAVVCKM